MTTPTPKQMPKAPVPLAARTFRASRPFCLKAGGFALLNVLLSVGFAFDHQIKAVPLFGALAIAFATLYLSAVTLQVTMDEDGLAQRWVWGRRKILWHEVASIERLRRALLGDGLFLLDEKNKEIFAISVLPLDAQELITGEAIKRARLRKDKAALKRPIIARWVRK